MESQMADRLHASGSRVYFERRAKRHEASDLPPPTRALLEVPETKRSGTKGPARYDKRDDGVRSSATICRGAGYCNQLALHRR
jgi:hypothetical protein